MAQLFPKSFNTLAKASLVFGGLLVVGLLLAVLTLARSPYVTGAKLFQQQPVPFSHKHHVSDIGIDCRFCHSTVETSAVASLPPTSTCMTCHSQLFTSSPLLEPVRQSWRTGKPIPWVRVNDLPDFAYFDHSIHVKKGVACVTCHGPVGEMPLVYRYNGQEMKWCLECHRNPAKFVRPAKQVFNVTYDPKKHKKDVEAWIQGAHLKSVTNCSTCHR